MKKSLINGRFRESGVAYLALMIAVAILMVVAASAVQLGAVSGQRDAEEELLFVGAEYQHALQRYAAMTPPGLPRAPATPEALLRDPRHPGIVRHLRRDYVDPMSGGARQMLVRDQRGLVVGVHSTSKLKPVRQIARELVVDAAGQASSSVQPSYADWIFWGPERPLLLTAPAGSANAPMR